MSLIGDSKEEDREIFKMLRKEARDRRDHRKTNALEYLSRVQELVDGGRVTIDPNGTWNMRIRGVSCQYWPTKGQWQYTSPKLVAEAKARLESVNRRRSANNQLRHYSYPVSSTQFGGGIHKFLQFLQGLQ